MGHPCWGNLYKVCTSPRFCKETAKVINQCWLHSQLCWGVRSNFNFSIVLQPSSPSYLNTTVLCLGAQLNSSVIYMVWLSATSQTSSANLTSRRPPTLRRAFLEPFQAATFEDCCISELWPSGATTTSGSQKRRAELYHMKLFWCISYSPFPNCTTAIASTP